MGHYYEIVVREMGQVHEIVVREMGQAVHKIVVGTWVKLFMRLLLGHGLSCS